MLAPNAGLMQAALGESRLLAWPGERRLHLLDPVGAVLWDLWHQRWAPQALTELLGDRFGLSAIKARAYLDAQVQGWRSAGLLDVNAGPAQDVDLLLEQADDLVWPAPRPRALAHGERCVVVADRRVAIRCANPVLARQLSWVLGTEDDHAGAQSARHRLVDHGLELLGNADAWHLRLDGASVGAGTTGTSALPAVVGTLTELGCRPAERLMVVHGAGVVAPNGRGMLLVAPGGSGKTTLAAALDASGFGLLSDDVVPVNLAGELLGLGLPLCLKPGSWPVLQDCRPEVLGCPPVQRHGQLVRYLPPKNPAAGAMLATAAVVLCRYAPGEPAGLERISPQQALQGLIEAEAVLRQITQAKLDALARWLDSVPAYHMHHPDLDSGLRLVHTMASACTADQWAP